MDNRYIEIIEKNANEILKEFDYPDEPIRDDIFKILRKKGVIIFFPMEAEKDLDGFHVDRVINGKIVPFVYINSYKYFDKCIFCAAHELGHIYEIEKRVLEAYPEVDMTDEFCDEIMNRFAAELLMPKNRCHEILNKNIKKIKTEKLSEIDIMNIVVSFMDYFFTPYKAVILRLYEIGFLNELGKEHFYNYSDSIIESYISKGNYIRPRQKNNICQMDDLEEIIRTVKNNTIVSASAIQKLCEDFNINLDEEVTDYYNNSALNQPKTNLLNQGGKE